MPSSPAHPSPDNCPQTFPKALKASFTAWSNDNASLLSAAVAYYAIFSIGPLLMISLAIVGVLWGPAAAADQVRPHLANILGDKVAASAQQLLVLAHYSPSLSFAGILSLALLIYAATNLFTALQSAFNTIFDVAPKPGLGWKIILRQRIVTFLMVFIVGIFVLATIALNTVLSSLTKWGGSFLFGNHSPMQAFLLQAVAFLVSCVVFTGVFALLLKYLPDIKIDWKDTLWGASLTAIVFSAARLVLSVYLARSSTTGPFGAAGSLVIVMLFVYYSTQILFFGAEFTEIWACRNGTPITPSKNAVWRGQKFRQRQNGKSGGKGTFGHNRANQNLAHWWDSRPNPGRASRLNVGRYRSSDKNR